MDWGNAIIRVRLKTLKSHPGVMTTSSLGSVPSLERIQSPPDAAECAALQDRVQGTHIPAPLAAPVSGHCTTSSVYFHHCHIQSVIIVFLRACCLVHLGTQYLQELHLRGCSLRSYLPADNCSPPSSLQSISRDGSGAVIAMGGELHLEGSVKTTKLKLTWLPQVAPSSSTIPYHPRIMREAKRIAPLPCPVHNTLSCLPHSMGFMRGGRRPLSVECIANQTIFLI